MKKRIEEFTKYELWNVYHKFGTTKGPLSSMQAVLDYIKANLCTGKTEPMSVEEITRWLQDGNWEKIDEVENLDEVATIIQPLTVQQGFVVDWSKAPTVSYGGEAKRVQVLWSWHDGEDALRLHYKIRR